MTNAIANTGTLPPSLATLAQQLGAVRQHLPEPGGATFMRLLKEGRWVCGKDDDTVAEGTEIAINPTSIRLGYIAWPPEGVTPRKPLGEEMFPLGTPLPPVTSMPAVEGDGWQKQFSVGVRILGGPLKDKEFTIKGTSDGLSRAVSSVIEAIIGRLASGSVYVVPIAELKTEFYKHPQYGRIYKPVFDIVAWADMDGAEEPDSAAGAIAPAEPEQPAEPAPSIRAEPENRQPRAAAEAPAADEPVRRRRRA